MPTGAIPGPACHHCGAPAEMQHQRHLTQAEYDALPENMQPIDGYATMRVDDCGDHHLPPFCEHPVPDEQPCPACHAPAGRPCVKPDGSERPARHPERIAATPQPQACRHAHREDCGGYDSCQCSSSDAAPQRTPRVPPPDDSAERAAHLQTVIAAETAWLQQLVAKHGGNRDAANQEARDTYNAFMAEHVAAQVEAARREIPYAGQRQIEGAP